MNSFKGNPVSQGIGIGHIYVYEAFEPMVDERYFDAAEVSVYKDKYLSAKLRAGQELQVLQNSMADADKAGIFKAHLSILEDEVIEEEILYSIQAALTMPDYAVFKIYNAYIDILSKSPDALTKERAQDLIDVRNRLIRNLNDVEEKNLSALSRPSIIAARDLLPSDTATMDRANVLGIATEVGGKTSHSAIIAKSYGIPAVLGLHGLMEYDGVCDEAMAVLDAISGELILNPGPEVICEYKAKKAEFDRQRAVDENFAAARAVTTDGVKIDIGINIGTDKLCDLSKHADFVGLFRTEFLYMEKSHMPTEDEQFEAYKAVLSAMAPRPVTLRTLDIGGDKKLDYLPFVEEDNPFLGNRALRLCFDQPGLFRTQLRAALRASVYGELWLMFPMVGSLEDLRRAKMCLEEAEQELDAEGIEYSKNIKTGMMIEIPSAAIFADKFAKEVDFASIGTNDLTQYLFATDRMNPKITSYYQEFSPILFKTLAQIADAFNKAGKPISICGELAGNHMATAILVGLGLKKLSMSASSFGKVRRAITELNFEWAVKFAENVLSMGTEKEVMDVISST